MSLTHETNTEQAMPTNTVQDLAAQARVNDDGAVRGLLASDGTGQDRLAKISAAAYRIRHHALNMGEVQGQGYVGQALGAADMLATVYGDQLNFRAEDPHWEARDRFLLSTGHYAIGHYAALAEAGIVPVEELETYGSDDSRLPMSGMSTYTPGMEISGGSLGHGLTIAVGMALGLRYQGSTQGCSTSSPTANWTKAPPGRPPWAPTTTSSGT
jgi:transketolase